jgi:hypothetical protein
VLLSYLPAFFAAGAMCLVAAAIVWLVRAEPASQPPRREAGAASPAAASAAA